MPATCTQAWLKASFLRLVLRSSQTSKLQMTTTKPILLEVFICQAIRSLMKTWTKLWAMLTLHKKNLTLCFSWSVFTTSDHSMDSDSTLICIRHMLKMAKCCLLKVSKSWSWAMKKSTRNKSKNQSKTMDTSGQSSSQKHSISCICSTDDLVQKKNLVIATT